VGALHRRPPRYSGRPTFWRRDDRLRWLVSAIGRHTSKCSAAFWKSPPAGLGQSACLACWSGAHRLGPAPQRARDPPRAGAGKVGNASWPVGRSEGNGARSHSGLCCCRCECRRMEARRRRVHNVVAPPPRVDICNARRRRPTAGAAHLPRRHIVLLVDHRPTETISLSIFPAEGGGIVIGWRRPAIRALDTARDQTVCPARSIIFATRRACWMIVAGSGGPHEILRIRVHVCLECRPVSPPRQARRRRRRAKLTRLADTNETHTSSGPCNRPPLTLPNHYD
jgi:hypothetical protein